MRDRDGRKIERDKSGRERERKIGRETGWEKEIDIQGRKRGRDKGERERERENNK